MPQDPRQSREPKLIVWGAYGISLVLKCVNARQRYMLLTTRITLFMTYMFKMSTSLISAGGLIATIIYYKYHY